MDRSSHRRVHLGISIAVCPLLWWFGPLSLFQTFVSFLIWNALASGPDVDTILPFSRHRGFSHTFLLALILGTLTFLGVMWTHQQAEAMGYVMYDTRLWAFSMGASVTLSWCMHIVEDMMTKGGGFVVRPLWPIMWNGSVGVVNYDSIWLRGLSWIVLLSAIGFWTFWVLESFGVVL